jgi:tetratricopeptide (TPR) repeat protein
MAHLWLGRAFGLKADHINFFSASGWARKTVQEFETAVKLSPRNLEARFDLLEYYLEAPGIVGGGREKALAEVKEIAGINPRQGHTARARVYRQDKKWAQARQELTLATGEFPYDSGAFLDLADFLLDRGDYADADSSARKALELDRESITAKFILSAAAVGLKRKVAEARQSLAQLSAGPLRDSDPGFEEVYYWLGRAYQEEGKTSEARQAFQTALRFDPEYKAAKSALSEMHT